MKIETRLNVGDPIFFLHGKKVVSSKVQGIKAEIKSSKETEIVYLCNSEEDQQVNLKVEEKYSFISKEDLIKSL